MVVPYNLMDLSNPFPQDFAFPNPTIKYIFQNSVLVLQQKLMKSCKTFKIMHLQFGQSYIKELIIFQDRHKFDLISYCINTTENIRGFTYNQGYAPVGPKYLIQIKKIKIMDSLILSNIHPLKFHMILPKLDLSKNRILITQLNFEIKLESLEMLLQPLIKTLVMCLRFVENIDPVLLAFQRCPQLIKIRMDYTENSKSIITKSNFKKLVNCKREKRLLECRFSPVSDIDKHDFINFADNFFAPKSTISFRFKAENQETFNEMEEILDKTKIVRKKERIPFPVVFLYCNGKTYKN